MRWFVRGDLDGFFGLALDNLVQLLLIDTLCRFVLGFPPELLYGRILPGAAVSLLFGNLFYAWQARKLAESTGRDDITALPYGINTVSLFAHVLLVMLPAKLAAEAAGAADPARIAWQAGLLATLGSGLIELGGAFVADHLRRVTPRAALLSTLSGIALGFISLGFLFRTFAHPIVGLSTLGVVLLTYFGRVRFKGGLPGGLVAVGLGTALAWATALAPVGERPDWAGMQLPVPVIGDVVAALSNPAMLTAYCRWGCSMWWAPCRTSSPPRPPATASLPARPWPSTAAAPSSPPSLARAFPRPSTSVTRGGRPWVHARATRSSTASSSRRSA